ncbi:MAG: hypothetical protein QM662_10725 [Gordonia sp. (in: high G+C Gram-positive bacteria)]
MSGDAGAQPSGTEVPQPVPSTRIPTFGRPQWTVPAVRRRDRRGVVAGSDDEVTALRRFAQIVAAIIAQ